MRQRNVVTLAVFALATAAFAQDDNQTFYPISSGYAFDALQIRYVSNLNKGDSVINITNVGGDIADFDSPNDNICVNVYTFDPSEEMLSCCSCLLTPNALVSLSVQGDLISNTLSPSTPTSAVIKLVATDPSVHPCDPALDIPESIALGMRAWGTTLHALPDGTYGVVESGFQFMGTPPNHVLNKNETNHLSSFCGFIESNGSGFGICKSCRTGGLGGAKQ